MRRRNPRQLYRAARARAGRLASTRDTRLAHVRSHGRPDRIERATGFSGEAGDS